MNLNLILSILLLLIFIISVKNRESYDNEINPLIVVMSCKKNSHLWHNILKRTKQNLIIFYANPNLKSNYTYSNRILCLKCRDTYDGLPEKVLCMIRAILSIKELNKYSHILKIDDHDTEVSENIHNELKYKLTSQVNYAGQTVNCRNCKYRFYKNFEVGKVGTWHFNKCPKDSYWENKRFSGYYAPYINGGCGYVLSRLSMRLIDKTLPKNLDEVYYNHIYEDLMIGVTLFKNNIHPIKLPKMVKGEWVCNF